MTYQEAVQQFPIPEAMAGLRVDVALAKIFPEYSRSQLSTWIKADLVRVNNARVKPKDKINMGDILSMPSPLPNAIHTRHHAVPAPIPLAIIYEDDALLIVNKPTNLVVHPAAGHWQDTLVNGLLHYCPELENIPRAGIVHRLDKDTTGLLIVAKTLHAQTNLIRQLQSRTIKRTYHALVIGHVTSAGTVHTPFGRHPRHRLKMAVLPEGKEAITHYRILQHFPTVSLLEVQLETGRTHQIRVHCAHMHHPVVGDLLYAPQQWKGRNTLSATLQTTLTTFHRQALHAHALVLEHPSTQEMMHITAPRPDDFEHLITLFSQELYAQ